MENKTFFLSSKLWCVGTFALSMLAVSCAQDGFDNDEVFTPEVRNAQLESPALEDIIVTASPDGKSQTITWPVVSGAGGYLVSFYDEGNAGQYIVGDSIVDGCSVTTKREEDANYVFTIKTLGNEKMNNKGAETATVKKISTFTPTYKTIPAGTDLNRWFAEAGNLPADSIGVNLNYDLEGGAEYTVSGVLDFDANAVTLRSTSKTNHAKIKYTDGSSTINFTAGFNVKYVDFDCSAMANNIGVFAFSKNSTVPAADTVDPDMWKFAGPVIVDPVTIVNCNFEGVGGYFLWDNSQKTCALTVLVDNCLVHMTPSNSNSGGVFWSNKGGHFNDLTVSNSTFYNIEANGDFKYFYQAGNVAAQDVYNNTTATNSVNYLNCTFYRLGWNDGQWGNYNRMNGRNYSYFVMTNCIFWECSKSGSVPRRFLHGNASNNHTFANNTYAILNDDGTVGFQDPQNYDTSGTIIEENPGFANPAAGDFHISGALQIARKTGDPRWLP